MKPFAAVIVAAGQGKRLGALGERYGKPMVPVAGRPLIDWCIERLHQAGAERVVVVAHPANQGLRQHLAEAHPAIAVVLQAERLGIADAVAQALPAVADLDAFLCCACDSLFPVEEMRELVILGQATPGAAVVGVLKMGIEATRTRSEIVVDGGRVVAIEEKPMKPRSPLVGLPLYWLPTAIAPWLSGAAPIKGERHVTSALASLIEAGGVVLGHAISERLEITAPEDISKVEERLLAMDGPIDSSAKAPPPPTGPGGRERSSR